jgi:hypothetical protein
MDLNANINTALIAVVSAAIGVYLQYKFGILAEKSKQYQNLKSQAYIDFIKSAAGSSIAQKHRDAKGMFDFKTLMTDSKIRIAIYGSREVVELVADFFRRYGSLDLPESCRSFSAIVRKMRAESMDRKEFSVNDNDISQLIFDSDLQIDRSQ